MDLEQISNDFIRSLTLQYEPVHKHILAMTKPINMLRKQQNLK